MQDINTYIEMIKNIPASIAVLDENINYLFASREWLKDYGLAEDIYGKNHYEVFDNIPQRWKEIHAEVLKTGIEQSKDEDSFILDDGSEMFLSWVVAPWFKENKEVGGLIFKSRDVTPEVKFRKDLELAQKIAKIGSWSFNLKTQKITWSKEMYNIFPEDISLGEPEFEKHRSTIHPEDVEHWEKTVHSAITEGKEYSMRFRCVHPDKVVWIEANGRLKRDEKGEVIELFGTCQDITDRVKQSEKLNELNDELREFSYRISHDLKSPLTSIEGLINLGREEIDDKVLLEECFSGMESLIEQLKDNITSSLSVIRNDAIDINVMQFCLEDINNRILKLYGPQIEKEKIHYQFQGGNIQITTDKSLLLSIIENLISNAIKYRDDSKDSFIQLVITEESEKVYFSIKDNGLGINEKFHEKLFSMFSRFHSVSEGTGLGLYTLKKTLHRLGGDISFESVEGEGTEFKFHLPSS